MLSAKDVARYFLNSDKDKKLFTTNVIERNSCTFYDGNARLNKYLHLAQNIYIAMYGEKLFEESLYAYANGAVVLEVQENYKISLNRTRPMPKLSQHHKNFLDKIYDVLETATVDELIELSHEDNEWLERIKCPRKQERVLDSLSRTEEYKEQYADVIMLMGGFVS